MLTALVATLGAALYGLADFLGGLASRKDSALVVTITVQATGFVVLCVLAFVMPPQSWSDPKILWGIGAGALGGTGVLALYAGLATGRMSVVAPVTAALAAALPAGVDLSTGAELRWTAIVGMACALVAVIIVSAFAEDEGGDVRRGPARTALFYAIVSGVGFGLSILCWAQTPASTGVAPLIVARATAVSIFVTVALLFRGGRVLPSAGVRNLAVITGVVDVAANLSQVIALRMGPLALAAVLGALYPVATILLARFVLHEHLRGWQRVGIALALVAVVLCALP